MTRNLTAAGLFFLIVAALGAVYVRSVKAGGERLATPQQQAAGTQVVAYYFHLTARCTTCLKIENYSREVIERKFASEVASGRLRFKLVNVQLDENRHFVKDYQIYTKSLVLVRFDKGRQAEYKVLNDTWELVGDKSSLQRYVELEVGWYRKRLT